MENNVILNDIVELGEGAITAPDLAQGIADLWLVELLRRQKRIAQGLVAEVERLYRRGGLSPVFPSVRTVGYRQVWEYLTGKITYNQMTEQAIAATRQLAKRQLTWLRRHEGSARLFDSMEGTERLCLRYLHPFAAVRT